MGAARAAEVRRVAGVAPCGSAVSAGRGREVSTTLTELAECGGNSGREEGWSRGEDERDEWLVSTTLAEPAGGWEARSVAGAAPCGSAVCAGRGREVSTTLAELAECGRNSVGEAGLSGRDGRGTSG